MKYQTTRVVGRAFFGLRRAFQTIIATAAAAAILHCDPLSAASIGLDFSGDGPNVGDWALTPSDAAGVVSQTNWNRVNTIGGGDDVELAKGSVSPLVDSTGKTTAVRFSYVGNDSWNSATFVEGPNSRMMKGTLKQAGSPGPMTMTFTNLTSGTYDVYVYGVVDAGPVLLDVNIGNVTNYWYESAAFDEAAGFADASNTDPAAPIEGNYVKFAGVTPVNGAINIQAFYREMGNGLGITGVQLVTAGNFPAFQQATIIGIQTQLTDKTVFAGTSATLMFAATNNASEPMTYQWYRAGQPIQGAASGTYIFRPVVGDNNAQLYAVATTSVGGLSVTSAVVTLTVKANDRAVITFSDQQGNDLTANPNPYTSEQGLPGGVTVTFEGFSNWRGSQDHTETADNYLLYGDNYDAGGISKMTFNTPVEVLSLWTATTAGGGQAGVATLVAYLGDREHYRLVLQNAGFAEVTLGVGKLIDRVEFIDYGDSWIDDITVVRPAVLSFSEQTGNDGDANPSVYGEAQGMPAGVIATFAGFSNWNGSQDHTPTVDNYLLFGNSNPPGGMSTITFNTNVIVPSLWVSTQGGEQSGNATIEGRLKGVAQFTYVITAPGFIEVTNGAGKSIDTLRFVDYSDAWIDDVTVLRAPTPPPLPPPLLTFSDQIGNDFEANPNIYTDAQGLPSGVTATFTGFNNWQGNADHTPSSDDYLLYGANSDPGVLTFNKPVEVPSFWVSAQGGGLPGVAKIQGLLGTAEQFSFTVPAGGWTEVTLGAGKTVDAIRFTDYGDSWIDDVLVREFSATPPRLSIVRKSATTATLSWTGSGTLQQSSALTGGWATAPNQQSTQDINTTGTAMFFRLIR